MQWLIDLIIESLPLGSTLPSGSVIAWYGDIEAIPENFVLCDGDNDTPNLKNKFIPGAGGNYTVGQTGGSVFHKHDFTTPQHIHDLDGGSALGGSGEASLITGTPFGTTAGETDSQDHRPPWVALAYIMKV